MESKVKEYCEKVYQATVKLLQLKNIERPAQYQSAVEGKESARSDIILAENERQQKLTVSYTALDKSYQLANATLDSAYTDGNITLAFAKADATAVTERCVSWWFVCGCSVCVGRWVLGGWGVLWARVCDLRHMQKE
jgi:hypothetical protein